MNENEVIINDQFGNIPYYEEGYGVLPRNKYVDEYVDFMTDQEVYDAEGHKATSFSVVSATTNFLVGGEYLLTLEPAPGVANVPVCVWESSDPTIAVVNGQGMLHPFKEGDVTITVTDATDTAVKATLNVSITDPSAYVPTVWNFVSYDPADTETETGAGKIQTTGMAQNDMSEVEVLESTNEALEVGAKYWVPTDIEEDTLTPLFEAEGEEVGISVKVTTLADEEAAPDLNSGVSPAVQSPDQTLNP